MSEFQPRNPDANALLLFLGGAVLLILCVGSVLLLNRFTRQPIVFPTVTPLPRAVIFPTLLPSPTESFPVQAYPAPVIIPTATPGIVFQEAAPIAVTGGKSCSYAYSWINAAATPIPDGQRSEIQSYLCANGYWYIGTKDWVDAGTDDWGTDGIEESAFVLYNGDGSVADRKFINLQGTTVPGPRN